MELPPEPWPTMLADLPLWIKKPEEESPMQVGKFARAHQRFTVKGEILESKNPTEETIREIYNLLCGLGAGVDSIRWDGFIFRGFGSQEPHEGWQNHLPRKINGFSICYFWSETVTDSNFTDHPSRRSDLDNTEQINPFDKVSINTPLHGELEGCHVETEWSFITFAENNIQEEKNACIVSHFSYWGNGKLEVFPEGYNAGFVWSERLENLGNFMFREKEGQRRVKIRGI